MRTLLKSKTAFPHDPSIRGHSGASEGILVRYRQPPEAQFTRGVRVAPLKCFFAM